MDKRKAIQPDSKEHPNLRKKSLRSIHKGLEEAKNNRLNPVNPKEFDQTFLVRPTFEEAQPDHSDLNA